MTAYTQDALFPDTAITGTGNVRPWPIQPATDQQQAEPAQTDTLPFGQEDAA